MITMVRWQDHAACVGMDPELFFPEYTYMIEPIVLAVCSECPVRDHCRQYAIDTKEDHGVWGGLNEEQRAALNRTRSRVHCPDCHSDRVTELSGSEFCVSCGLSWPV